VARQKYSDFVDRLDVDALEEALGFDVLYQDGKGNDVGYCLFPENHSHGDTTGKFAIHRESKVYNCWVCGGGSLLSLVMEFKGWDSETAVEWLTQFVGDQRPDKNFVEDFLLAFARDSQKRVETLPYFNPRVLDQWEPAYRYAEEQGLNNQVVDTYGIKYAANMVKASPRRGKFADDEDYVGPAYIFPHYWNERLVGWQCRWLDEDRPEWVKKWTNTDDFPKSETLYGWDRFPGGSSRVVVESVKTVHRFADNHMACLSTFGDSVSDEQIRLLRRYKILLLCPDNDKAGRSWLAKLYHSLNRFVPEIAVAQPVPGLKSDMADIRGVEFEEHLSETFHWTEPGWSPNDLNWAFT
jgi:DNA primase